MNIRVTIVEDDQVLRDSLAALIRGTSGFTLAGAHASAEQAGKALSLEKPDVLLLDLELPHMSGEDFIRQARQRWPKLEILVLTIHDTPVRIFEALGAGATGYLVKPAAPAKILEAIVEVHAGGSPMSSQIARMVIRTFQTRSGEQHEVEQLTAREAEILALLSRGHRYQEIADQLKISVHTVTTHLHRIYEKLHVRSRGEAAARYMQR